MDIGSLYSSTRTATLYCDCALPRIVPRCGFQASPLTLFLLLSPFRPSMLRLATSTSRSTLRTVSAPCTLCQQRRSAHKLVEVELIKDVLGVGVVGTSLCSAHASIGITNADCGPVGDRLPLSPGFVRNRLLPLGQALLIVKGKPASPLRDMMKRERIASMLRAKFAPKRSLVAADEVAQPIKAVRFFLALSISHPSAL